MNLSCIIATIGEKLVELEKLISSIVLSKKEHDVEIIIVSQSHHIEIENMIMKYSGSINIVHIKSSVLGISHNRNLGLNIACGEILAFPDDDCYYHEDVIGNVIQFFQQNNNNNILVGRHIDPDNGRSPRFLDSKMRTFSKKNIFEAFSSITIFIKLKEKMKFDENLGAGTFFGASEESDLIYRYMEKNDEIGIIDLRIIIFHKVYDYDEISLAKVKSYARGQGAWIKKENRYIKEPKIFIEKLIIRPLLGVILSLLLFQKTILIYRINRALGLYTGFFLYKNNV